MIQRLLGLVFGAGLLLAASAASATSGSLVDDGFPPERYQWLDSTATVNFTTQSEVDRVCGTAPVGFQTRGCELPDGTIHVQDPCGIAYVHDSYARLLCHELGHLHGWPATHPRP